MKVLAAIVLLMLGLFTPAAANDYSLENRPEVVFPGPRGGIVRESPYPAGKRAASVWMSDACWRECTASCGWRMQTCLNAIGPEACRVRLQACDVSCQQACRARGGPLVLGW